MSFDWKGLFGSVAPGLATVLSGGNPLVGAGVKVLSTALLGKGNGTKEEIEQTISSSLEDPVKMRELQIRMIEAEQAFKVKMEEIGIRYEELEIRREEIAAGDRKDARGMQVIAIQQEDKFVRRFVYWYAIMLTGLSFIYFFAVTFSDLDQDQRQIANIILGFLLGIGLGTIIAFFYGTSNGSLSKNKQIADLAARIPGGR